jgi:hypothetical protein
MHARSRARQLALIALVLAGLTLASAHRWSHQGGDSCVSCAIARDLLPLQSAPAPLPSPSVWVAAPVLRSALRAESDPRGATEARAPPRAAHLLSL